MKRVLITGGSGYLGLQSSSESSPHLLTAFTPPKSIPNAIIPFQLVKALTPSPTNLASSTMSPVPKSLPIQWMDGVLAKGQEAEFFHDEFRCPVYVKDFVNIIRILTDRWISDGKKSQLVLNVGGPNRLSRAEMAETVARVRGYNTSLIKPVSASSVSLTSFIPSF